MGSGQLSMYCIVLSCMFPSCLCCTIWTKYAITTLVRTRLKQRDRKQRFTVVCSRYRQNLKWSFYVVVLTSMGGKCTEMRVAGAVRSFFPLLTNISITQLVH